MGYLNFANVALGVIYPNPAFDRLIIDYNFSTEDEQFLYNHLGQMIYKGTDLNDPQIDISNFIPWYISTNY
jgi:hypothetical protein